MSRYLIYLIFTMFFALIIITLVPKEDIRHLSIYGIIFGGIMDVLVHIFGYVTGLFAWINYGPFGFIGVHLFANVTWTIFFILYYYFLPEQKPFNYIFAGAGVFFSILFYNLVLDLGIFRTSSRFILPLLGFAFWFSIATWGFYKLRHIIDKT